MTSAVNEFPKKTERRESAGAVEGFERQGVRFKVPHGAVVIDKMRDLGWHVDLVVMVMRPSRIDEKARLRLFSKEGDCFCEVRFYDGEKVVLDEQAFAKGSVVLRTLTRKEESVHYQKWPVREGLLSPFRYFAFHRQCSKIQEILDARMDASR